MLILNIWGAGAPIAYVAETEAELDEAKAKAAGGSIGNGAVAAPAPVPVQAAAPVPVRVSSLTPSHSHIGQFVNSSLSRLALHLVWNLKGVITSESHNPF